MKLVSFDLEIAKCVTGDDWQAQRPLGVSCAMAMTNGPMPDDPGGRSWSFGWKGEPQVSLDGAGNIVAILQWLSSLGFTFVTVNGAGFDFSVLAEESGMVAECADLMLNHHCDLMMMSVCRYGWRVGLDALAAGADVRGKLHEVTLSDGRIITNMNGAMAPQLWAEGEQDAVMAYLRDDVRATLETAVAAVNRGYLGWHSSKGKWWKIPLSGGRLPTVAECLTWDMPDTSWMSDPPDRHQMVAWAR